MSWWTRLFDSPRQAEMAMTTALLPPLASPWSTAQLTRVIVSDLMGVGTTEVDRAVAMSVPAIVRGRGLICGTLSRYPLSLWQRGDVATAEDVRLPTPNWMTTTNTRQSPPQRMLWTLDDLVMGGLSVWATERDSDGFLTDAVRIPPAYWAVDPDSLGVLIQGKPVSDEQVLVIEGPQEGLLTLAREAILASQDLAAAWQSRLKSPVPLVELHATDPNQELDDAEIDAALNDWEAARRVGGTAFTPSWLQANIHGDVKTDLFIEARNAERLDWGNYLQLPAAMLDGSMSTASLTYSTAEGKRSEFVDYSLNYWAVPVEARLSQDDITPDGTFVRYDISWLVNPVQPGRNPSFGE